MSGFLQRIGAAAVRPERRVHPFVRSLYQAASEPASQPVEISTERVRESTPGVMHVREGLNSPTHWNRTVADGEPEEQGASRTARRRESEETQRSRYEALLPEVLQETSAGFAQPRFRDDAIGHEGPEVQRRGRQRDEQMTGETRVFESPVSAERERDESVQLHRDSKTVASGTPSLALRGRESQSGKDEAFGGRTMRSSEELGAGRRQAQQQAMAQAAQRSSEIQIHIGRIEVTAMPPTVPRPVPTPARKSETLDEYLRQRNERAG